MSEKTKLDKNKIYFVDSYGRTVGIDRKALKAALRRRDVENVIEEVVYVLKRTKRSRDTTTVRDIAFELGVHYAIVKAVMNCLTEQKMVAYCDNCNKSIPNEKYSILLEPFGWSEEE